jgi:hypothetical protein
MEVIRGIGLDYFESLNYIFDIWIEQCDDRKSHGLPHSAGPNEAGALHVTQGVVG